MKAQWFLILALIFALFIAIFAVLNVDMVSMNYIFGNADIPLVLIILGSSLLGGLVVGLFGIIRQYKLQRTLRQLEDQLVKAASPKTIDPKPVEPLAQD